MVGPLGQSFRVFKEYGILPKVMNFIEFSDELYESSPIYLTLDDVQKIYTADLSETPHLAIQRYIFVFQCNIGCRIGDLLRLKKRDVINGAIEYIPTKTIKENARAVVVPLNSVAQEIVDRY